MGILWPAEKLQSELGPEMNVDEINTGLTPYTKLATVYPYSTKLFNYHHSKGRQKYALIILYHSLTIIFQNVFQLYQFHVQTMRTDVLSFKKFGSTKFLKFVSYITNLFCFFF